MPSPIVESTFAFVKPDAFKAGHADAIVKRVQEEGFDIVAKKEMTLPVEVAKEFYLEHKDRPFYGELVEFMTSGPVLAMILQKEGAIKAWRQLIGPTNSNKAREESPNSLRALYGKDGSENACHGSDAVASAAREMNLVFPEHSRTFAFIKPDAVRNGSKDAMLQRIEAEGFTIEAKKEITLSKEVAETFYAEHSARPFFNDLVGFMTSGPVVALVLNRANGIRSWRQLMGPTNSDKAREEAPNSIRALFGTDFEKNASHGSDSVESAKREIGVIFPEL